MDVVMIFSLKALSFYIGFTILSCQNCACKYHSEMYPKSRTT